MATRTSKVYLNLKATHFSGGFRPTDKGRGGGRSSRSQDKGGPGLQKISFRPVGPQFGLKIKWGGGGPTAPPLDPPLHFENDENRPVAPTRLERL